MYTMCIGTDITDSGNNIKILENLDLARQPFEQP
jgi:hypothetical protein